MPRNMAGTVLKIFIASLIVGLILSALDITPARILDRLGGSVAGALETGASMAKWALEYVLLGAMIVVPIWLIVVAVNAIRKRS